MSPATTDVIARYGPRSVTEEVAAFARTVVAMAEPASGARTKALLFAAAKLGTFATSVGLELAPPVVLAPSVIERYIVAEGDTLGGATARTVRSNLRALARSVLVHQPPAPLALVARDPRRPIRRPGSRPIWRWPTPSRRPRAGCAWGRLSAWGPGPG